MNKLTIFGVPLYRLSIMMICLLMSHTSLAQEETYTTIRKNVNPLAFELDHNLSDSQDSLLLENKFLFKKVRFLNKTTEKVFEFKPAVKSAKIPLDQLPLGKYTVMFYQADKIIVFQIDRLLPFDYEYETDVAMNDVSDVNLDSDLAMADANDNDLDHDTASLGSALNTADKDFEELVTHVKKSYNISDSNRNNVMSRAEYRRTHLRPNGKPYND